MSTTELQTVKIHRRGGVATIELARPETMNAWNKQFGLDLLAAVQQVTADDEIRAVAITGAGKGFSSGADLRDISDEQTPEGRPDVYKVLTERYHPIITGIRTMPKPVVAAVNGPAVGRPTSSSPRSPRTSCWPSSTSASSPTAARRSSSPSASASRARWRWRCSASASPRPRPPSGA
jgi:hypothetical protein